MQELGVYEGRRYGIEGGVIYWDVPDVREAIRAGARRKLVIADYSQIEIRLMAFMAQETLFIDALNADKDIHVYMASEVSGIDYQLIYDVVVGKDKAHPRFYELTELRSGVKTVTFGVPYGAGPPRIASMIRRKDKQGNFIETEEEALARAEKLIADFFVKAWRLRIWLDERIVEAQTPDPKSRQRISWSSTINGRRRYYELPDRNHPDYRRIMSQIGRYAGNMPIQGCLNSGSRIFEQSAGYVRIETLAGKSVKLWDGRQWAKARVVASGIKELMRIRLMDGTILETSPDHRFQVNTPKITRWMSLAELEKIMIEAKSRSARNNYRVALSAKVPDWNLPLEIPKPAKCGVHNAHSASLQGFGKRLFDMGLFLGRLASDGSVSYKYNYSRSPLAIRATPRKHSWSGASVLFVAEHEKEILPELYRIASILGKPQMDNLDRSSEGKEPMHHIVMPWTALAKQLDAIGIKGQIPEFVWSSRTLLCGYLRGMFDGDGGVHPDGSQLTFGQGDKFMPWALEIQQALRLLGIRSRVHFYPGKSESSGLGCTRVAVLKADSQKFRKRVNFINSVKRNKLRAVGTGTGHKGNAAYGQAVSIKSIERTGLHVPMYDVVDSETGQFAANGVIVHNSSADMLKDALRRLRRMLRAGRNLGPTIVDGRLLLVNHDEVVMDAAEKDAEQVQFFLEQAMTDAYNAVTMPGKPLADGTVPVLKLSDIKIGKKNRVEAIIADYWSKD